MNDENTPVVPPVENVPLPENEVPQNVMTEEEEEDTTTQLAVKTHGNNEYFRRMMDFNYLVYANYVIGSRAIPDVDDGLKPVQRRILWVLHNIYDNGRTTKTANIVGNTMHFHPHGDASIGGAVVVLANKGGWHLGVITDPDTGEKRPGVVEVPYLIAKQGNFGNILTGSPAAAARYTECALTKLAYETMFNNDITRFIPNYDGTKKEPLTLPAKIPALLLIGSDGIAVGMSTTVLPHNFNELLEAEIACLQGEPFELYPDFQQGGLMDVREYEDGNGKITLRAKIDIDGRDLVIREIPATCTSASLVESIEKAWKKGKIKISSVDDFTTDQVEIRVTPTRGYDPEKTRQGLYMYTDCSVSISPNLVVLKDRKPVQMTVTEVIRRNVGKLLGYFEAEFKIALFRLHELRHTKTLAQLFFENRIYKRIEESGTEEDACREVMTGLAPFAADLEREITKEDVDKLLALPVRRIARFDIEKNQRELKEIAADIRKLEHKLKHLTEHAIEYLTDLKNRYGKDFPRHTEIENMEKIDRKQAALTNIKIGWERKTGYIGSAVKSDDVILCSEFDRVLCVCKDASYKVMPLPPEKLFIGKLYDFRRFDAKTVFGIIYREKKSGKYYAKRSSVGGFILEKEYRFAPEGCVLELLTPRPDAVYTYVEEGARGKQLSRELNLMEFPLRKAAARGLLIGSRPLVKLTHSRYLEAEELSKYAGETGEDGEAGEENANDIPEETPPESGVETPVTDDRRGIPLPELIPVDLDLPEIPHKAAKTKTAAEPEKTITEAESAVKADEPVKQEEPETQPVKEPPEEKPEKAEIPPEPEKAAEVEIEAETSPETQPEETQPEPEIKVEPEKADEPEESKPETETEPETEEPAPAETSYTEKPEAQPPAPQTDKQENALLVDVPVNPVERPKSQRSKTANDAAEDELGIIQPEFGF